MQGARRNSLSNVWMLSSMQSLVCKGGTCCHQMVRAWSIRASTLLWVVDANASENTRDAQQVKASSAMMDIMRSTGLITSNYIRLYQPIRHGEEQSGLPIS